MMSSKLLPLNMARLHHAEFGQLIVRFFEDFAGTRLSTAADADFKKLYDALHDQVNTFNGALNQIKANEESEQIAALDESRDTALQNLRNALKPYRSSSLLSESEAYTALSLLILQYKEVEDDSYESETNKLNNLSDRLKSSQYAPHVGALEIGKFVTRLSDANAAFNDLFSHRSFKVSQKVVYDVKALRKKFTEDYSKMTDYIATMASVKEDSYYKDVLAIINNGRNYFSSVILSRRTVKKPDEDKM